MMLEEPEPSFCLRVFNLKKDDQFRFLDLAVLRSHLWQVLSVSVHLKIREIKL